MCRLLDQPVENQCCYRTSVPAPTASDRVGSPTHPKVWTGIPLQSYSCWLEWGCFFSRIHCSALQYALHHPMAQKQLNGILCLVAIWINIFTLNHVGICTSPWTKGRWDPMTQGAELAESLRPRTSHENKLKGPAVFCICSTALCFSLRLVWCFLHLAYVTWSLVIIGPSSCSTQNLSALGDPDRQCLMRSLLLQANREIAQVHLSLIVMTDGNDSIARGCGLLKYIEVLLQPLPWSSCHLAVSYCFI